ncbi:TraV family lipoprotein [Croceicoccus hydrothermalis]|uniref:TraV family lipoprotein n=1 Tax=Croceicoccus hydrothermalis TaxID=2867964 RepID=UPI001EFBE4CA|nr:TraV family lipoprotein [Croceicoccus hydrothermalis]
MRIPSRLLATACLAMLASGCATFGTNIDGDFTCRAPKGDCAPSHVIDARATSGLTSADAGSAPVRQPVPVAAGDQNRTSERVLRIVFPAHVDANGTLHDDAIAWAVVENPRWVAELRRQPGEETAPPLMRQLRRQLKAVQSASEAQSDTAASRSTGRTAPGMFGPVEPFRPLSSPQEMSSLDEIPSASSLVLPSTAREAVAGAHAPAAEGFDMSQSPHDRAPRPTLATPRPGFPSLEAIEAAKSASPSHEEPN